jgi:hypothetical protein
MDILDNYPANWDACQFQLELVGHLLQVVLYICGQFNRDKRPYHGHAATIA